MPREFQRTCGSAEFGSVNEHLRRCVFHDSHDFRGREAPIQRDEGGAELAACKLYLENVSRVVAEHRHPIAMLDSEMSKMGRKTRASLVHLRVCKRAAGMNVRHRPPAGRNSGVVGNPSSRPGAAAIATGLGQLRPF